MSSTPSASFHSHRHSGSDDMMAVQGYQPPQGANLAPDLEREQGAGGKSGNGQSDAQWATEVYRNAGSHQAASAGSSYRPEQAGQSEMEELQHDITSASPPSQTYDPSQHHHPLHPRQARPHIPSRASTSSSIHSTRPSRPSPLPSPGSLGHTAQMPLPPDQQSISDTASTLSMSVRVPSRIPSSAERKSSLPPPISPRSASLSVQQMTQARDGGGGGGGGASNSHAGGGVYVQQGQEGRRYGQNVNVPGQGGPSGQGNANASSSTLRGGNPVVTGNGNGSGSGNGTGSRDELGSTSRSHPNVTNSSGSGSGNPTSTLSAPTSRPNRSPCATQPSLSSQNRIPSRHLLQSALDLAQQAVQMDQNNDVAGALAAYREAVGRLQAVMDRVAADAERDGRRRRGPKAEEEGRTLQGIVSFSAPNKRCIVCCIVGRRVT